MILAVIQARLSSTRLPGKVLMPLNRIPMLHHVINAAKSTKLVDKVVVATSVEKDDFAIVKSVSPLTDVYQGDLKNVLKRFYEVANLYNPLHIVRLTGDCPLLQGDIIDSAIYYHLLNNNDYTRNFDFCSTDDIDVSSPNRERIGYPSGLDVEVFTMDTLLRTAKLATTDYDCEHVTPFMNSSLFKTGVYLGNNVNNTIKCSIDTKEEYDRIRKEMEENHNS